MDHKVKIKGSKKIAKILGPCQRTKKAEEHEGDGDTNFSWCAWNGHQMLEKRTGISRIQRKNGDHPDYGIVKIDKNTEKTCGYSDFRENSQFLLVLKTRKPDNTQQKFNNLNELRSKNDWVGKLIHKELCKRLTFNYDAKWYMHKTRTCPKKMRSLNSLTRPNVNQHKEFVS